LAATSLTAGEPAVRQVPFPAALYVMPVDPDTATTVQREETATATSPLGSVARWYVLPRLAAVGATPRNVPDPVPVPMWALMTPVDRVRARVRKPAKSEMYSVDPDTSTLVT
jgi:hypothetical protein